MNDFADAPSASDEKYWKKFAHKYYIVSKDYINLENGYYGIQPKPVLQAFQKNINDINAEGARFARKIYPEKIATVKKELAAFLQASDEEIIITRNATETLNIAIKGYPFRITPAVYTSADDVRKFVEAVRSYVGQA